MWPLWTVMTFVETKYRNPIYVFEEEEECEREGSKKKGIFCYRDFYHTVGGEKDIA